LPETTGELDHRYLFRIFGSACSAAIKRSQPCRRPQIQNSVAIEVSDQPPDSAYALN
jgi:hypothetical protein